MHNQIDTAKEEEEGPSFVSPHQILPMDNVIHDKFFTTRNQNSDDKKKITNKCRKDSMTRQEVCGLSVPQFLYVNCETNFKKGLVSQKRKPLKRPHRPASGERLKAFEAQDYQIYI